jgi:hypothetical protein
VGFGFAAEVQRGRQREGQQQRRVAVAVARVVDVGLRLAEAALGVLLEAVGEAEEVVAEVVAALAAAVLVVPGGLALEALVGRGAPLRRTRHL